MLATRHLSGAGRVQLINAILFAMHAYWSCLFILLKCIIKKIEEICRNFLCSQTADYQKPPPVAWVNVCRPKSMGGLGLKNCSLWNTAIVTKHIGIFLRTSNAYGLNGSMNFI